MTPYDIIVTKVITHPPDEVQGEDPVHQEQEGKPADPLYLGACAVYGDPLLAIRLEYMMLGGPNNVTYWVFEDPSSGPIIVGPPLLAEVRNELVPAAQEIFVGRYPEQGVPTLITNFSPFFPKDNKPES